MRSQSWPRALHGGLDLERLSAVDDDEASGALQRLRGIGRWSAEYALLRGLGRLAVFPGDDVGARNNLQRLLGVDLDAGYDAVRRAVIPWSPYAGLVYFHLLLDHIDRAGWLDDNATSAHANAPGETPWPWTASEPATRLDVGPTSYEIVRLDALDAIAEVSRLPFSVKVLLENLLRHEDGATVTQDDIEALARWAPESAGTREIAFVPARVLMQDFTGVPAIVDLAAMRDAMEAFGADPAQINPRVPVELIVDHSVIADVSGRPDAFRRNAELEFTRNRERYELLRWAQDAFGNVRVMPPDSGICHQVNLEYLARVVFVDADGSAYPDTLVGTDSHTPMVNGLGVLGWGVGGIEAEAAMLGEPLSLLLPAVVGVRLVGQLPEGSTATDLVLTIAERLRRHGVVGKFVEFYGPGVAAVPLENRATIGNMSPEYGSTCAMFPIDAETLRYLQFTGRPPEQIALVEAYAKEQGLFHEPGAPDPIFSENVEFDLAAVVPSIAGPARPHDRVPLTDARRDRFGWRSPRRQSTTSVTFSPRGPDEASAQSFPASDPPASNAGSSNPAGPERDPEPAPSSSVRVDARPCQPPHHRGPRRW